MRIKRFLHFGCFVTQKNISIFNIKNGYSYINIFRCLKFPDDSTGGFVKST
jgi:hypothetical protein